VAVSSGAAAALVMTFEAINASTFANLRAAGAT
jgi:hypothetical protein